MKRFVFLLCVSLSVFSVHAQDGTLQKKENILSKAYFGLGTGVNNPNGILGFNVVVPIKSVAVCGGVGISTWGNKIFAEGRYFLKADERGFAFAGGITHNTGRVHATLKLDTDRGKQKVTMNLYSVTNAYIAGYYFWDLGKHHNRVYVDLGYSVPLNTARFKQVFPPQGSGTAEPIITSSAKDHLREFTPGGLMAGLGFCFALR